MLVNALVIEDLDPVLLPIIKGKVNTPERVKVDKFDVAKWIMASYTGGSVDIIFLLSTI